MGDEDLDKADVYEFLHFLGFVGGCVSRASEVVLQKRLVAQIQAFQFIFSNLGVEYVLNSKKAEGELQKPLLAHTVNLRFCNLPFFLFLVKFEYFDVSHPNFFEVVD